MKSNEVVFFERWKMGRRNWHATGIKEDPELHDDNQRCSNPQLSHPRIGYL